MNGAPSMNTRSIGLISSTGFVFGLKVAGFRIRLADIIYFFPLLTVSLLTPLYIGYTLAIDCGILTDFTFLDVVRVFYSSAGAAALVVEFAACNPVFTFAGKASSTFGC